MKLGNLELANNLILAPMQNVTTAPFRRFCRSISEDIGLVCVPMLYTKRLTQKPESIKTKLFKVEEERPISVQLIGSDKISLKNAIDFLESYKFDFIDLNAGCPSKRAIAAREGGYLMKDLKTLEILLKTAVKHSSKPVSVKIRTGFKHPFKISQFASIINDSGVEFVTIHGRTVKERYQDSKINYCLIESLKKSIDVPLIGNGDVFTPEDARIFLENTGVNGLMIGRASIGNVHIFSQINDNLTNGSYQPFSNTLSEMEKKIIFYEKILDEFIAKGLSIDYPVEVFKFTELYRNSIWFSKGIRDSTSIREKISKTKDLKELKFILNETFN